MNSNYSITVRISTVILTLFISGAYAQKSPFFEKGNDPKTSNQKWSLIKEMSDEFNGKKVDESKWQYSGQGWIGRAPGLFMAENVKVAYGNLKIITTKLPATIVKNGNEFTHGGGYVGSRKGMTYGYYEARMKANKTFMSSTFWMINEKKGAVGCDQRTTELDIQECFGRITTDKEFTKKFPVQMNSNTHSRDIKEGCDYTKASVPAKSALEGTVYDDYHVYGVWWKSKHQILFYLDGKFQTEVKPAADFNLEMYLRMVVETYNWNPVPEDGGMTGSAEDRTTNYDWVRSWKLIE